MKESVKTSRSAMGGSLMSWGALAALLLFWLLLSGKYDVFHIGVGVASVTLVAWLQNRLPSLRGRGAPRLNVFRTIVYLFWLVKEMFVAAYAVARVILGPSAGISPRLFAFRCDQPSEVSAVLFANSITLTPGTITVDYLNDEYVVHALTRDTAADVLEGDMARRVARLSSDQPVTIEELPMNKKGDRL